MRRSVVLCVVCGSICGCGGEAWEIDPGGEEPVAAAEEPLLGTLGTASTPGCSASESRILEQSLDAARFVAVSKGFHECVSGAMSGMVGVVDLGDSYWMGPYVPQYDSDLNEPDAFSKSPLPIQISNALYAATSTNTLVVTCSDEWVYGDGTAALAYASPDRWRADKQAPEQMTMLKLWDDYILSDNGANATVSDYYQSSRAITAAAIWHEAMHRWGYWHEWDRRLKSIPFIVGACMETVMRMSKSGCAATSCGANRRPVRRFDSATCDCVDDPKYDVGVVLDASNACPDFGRGRTETVELFMDDENTFNANAHGGWNGQISSNSDTRFRFCRVPGHSFAKPRVATYAVARMGPACPPGAAAFSRTFSNEDSGNRNASSGHVPPHVSDATTAKTVLEFCMFRVSSSQGVQQPFPDFAGLRYGVFIGPAPGTLASGWIKTDDEDRNNRNALSGDFVGSGSFLSATTNTTLFLGRVR